MYNWTFEWEKGGREREGEKGQGKKRKKKEKTVHPALSSPISSHFLQSNPLLKSPCNTFMATQKPFERNEAVRD